MKQLLRTGACLLLLIFLLCFPQEALAASRDGMSLWLNTLLPTLLPFLILTGLLMQSKPLFSPGRHAAFAIRALLGLSPWGFYAFILGKLCGCPMGAKVCAELRKSGRISRREGEYLLTFSANPSPAFLTSYLCKTCLKGKIPTGKVLGILFLSDLLVMLFFRFVVCRGKTTLLDPPETSEPLSSKKETPAGAFRGAALDVSIMNGFETITRIGGYILLFSIISGSLKLLHLPGFAAKCLIPGLLELTCGLHGISESGLSFAARFLSAMTMTSFGGLCILAQTKSVLEGELSLIPYASARCLGAVFTAGLVIFLQ